MKPIPESSAEQVLDVHQTACCVVGGGPAGLVLALLLARRGVSVTLLESHKDFDREFRGDTIHPAILEILDEIGLAERLHQLPHTKLYGPIIPAAGGTFTPFDFRSLKTKFPYIMLMHQGIFLQYLAEEGAKYPNLHSVMGAEVQRLVEEGGAVRGVRYRAADGWHEVPALLTVAADGRFSKVRHLVGIEPLPTSQLLELLWFRLPRLPEDPKDYGGLFGRPPLVVFDRIDHWQAGYFIAPGSYQAVRAAGLEALRRAVARVAPRYAPHMEHLTDWRQLTLLSVTSSRCQRWYKPGLLLIGDAAHTMTPAAGAGIKYAIEDAVVAANLLAEPLLAGRVRVGDLAAVQRRREWPTRAIQALGALAIRYILTPIIRSKKPPGETVAVPRFARLLFRVPFVSRLFARMVAFGIWREHVRA